MGMILIPLFFVSTVVFSLNVVFFLYRRKEYVASNSSYLIGTCITIITFFISNSLVFKSWRGITHMTNNLFILYISILLLPGALGIIGVFIPKRFKLINTIGFAFAFSAILSGVLSIPYLFYV